MLSLVPDTDEKTEAAPEKQSPAASANVELDLDDAPFLSSPEPEPEPATPPLEYPEDVALPEPDKDDTAKKPKKGLVANKKKLVIISAAAVLLIAGGIFVNFFLFSAPKPKKEPTAKPAEARKVVVPSAPTLTPAPPLAQFMTKWAPFNVPLKGPEGDIALFTITIVVPTDDGTLHSEIEARRILLRDAVYYYLSKRTLESLMDSTQAADLRNDLVKVINEHLTSGKIDKVFIEDFYSSTS